MGFAPSAGWAQELTDAVTRDGGLPASAQVVIDRGAPASLPVWGSILDDVWAVAAEGDPTGSQWCDAAERQWARRGIEANVKKSVDDELGGEIQGLHFHGEDRTLALSVEKRAALMQALVRVL
eukprot:10533564-Lingulodinium_polyedra.AAC.1